MQEYREKDQEYRDAFRNKIKKNVSMSITSIRDSLRNVSLYIQIENSLKINNFETLSSEHRKANALPC